MKMHCGKFLKSKLHHGRHHFNGAPECGTWSQLECEGSSSDSSCSTDKLKHHKMGHHAHKMVHFGRKMGHKFGYHGHKMRHHGHKMGYHGHKMGHHGHKMGHHGNKMGHHGDEMDHHEHELGHHGHKMGHHGKKMCHQERNDMGHHSTEEDGRKMDHHVGKKLNKMGHRHCESKKNAIISNPEKFEIILSVKQFKPDEVSVKAVNNSIIVDCNHGERQLPNEFISRHILRRFEVPSGYDLEIIQSELSTDGILRVIIPKIQNVAPAVERVIPIIIEETAPTNQEIQEQQQVVSE